MPEEIEAKFYIPNLDSLREALAMMGAELKQKRVKEVNLRFDTAAMELSAQKKVLRLRQDERARLTFKAPGTLNQGVLARPEHEVEVSDFEETRLILEGLGYRVYSTYEKFRETWLLGEVALMLDEMPYGSFIELEGPAPEKIKALALSLGLNWEKRLNLSYMALFEHFRQSKGLTFNDLSFENFKGLVFTEEDFNDL
ncbi:MAG: class IV adenylate cyclase [Anaerolineaceae bacterium]|nr:class IV adenylate cyclase [Anaerolineaceae bacterium]